MLKYWILGLTATGVAFAATPWVAALARRVGALAVADERRVHHGSVPSLGGLALLLALLAALGVGALADEFVSAGLTQLSSSGVWLLAGLLVSVACGVADDVWHLGALPKLGFQLLAGIFVLLAGYGIGGVTNPLSGETIGLGWLGPPLTLLWVIGITNAFNLIDGLDGLAAGVGLIASGTLFLVALGSGQVEVAFVAIALVGALLGFLYYNFHPASVFLGDSGSLLLGFLLAVLSIHALQKGATAVVIATPILALGLPIADTALAMARRLLGALAVERAGRDQSRYRFTRLRSASILTADRDHIHHRLLALGLTQRRAVLLLYAVCFAFNLLAFMAVRARGEELALLVALPAIATWIAIRKLGYDEVALLHRGTFLPFFDLPVLNRRALLATLDAGFVATAYSTAVFVVGGSSLDPDARRRLISSVLLVTAVKLAVFVYTGVYLRSRRSPTLPAILANIRSIVAADVVSVAILSLLLGLPPAAAPLLLLDFYFTLTLVLGSRVSFRLLESVARAPRASAAAQPVLIYGPRTPAAAFLREALADAHHGYRPVGFLDEHEVAPGATIADLPVIGGPTQLEEFLQLRGPCDIVVATSATPLPILTALALPCQNHGARVLRFSLSFEPIDGPNGASTGV